ncbi:MAG: hypothetical protein ACP5GO_01885 [Thermoprotei archaeon]
MEIEVGFIFDDDRMARAIFVATSPDNRDAPDDQIIEEIILTNEVRVKVKGEVNESFLYTIEDMFDKVALCESCVRSIQNLGSRRAHCLLRQGLI